MTRANGQPVSPVALRPREAAKALGIGRTTLKRWTAAGIVKATRIGKVTLYDLDDLRKAVKR